ncbi:hypothetical protein [Allomuricauda sp. d1]|uniref:hypothetical protein n=1 Tax=Allomuricauda sp. d1 TaxID=3136725 RepID=UPI0031D48E8A
MKKTRFYPTVWQAMTFPSGVVGQWDNSGRRIKEMILKNDMATELGISEMELNLIKITAFDEAGNEHHILDFPGQNPLPIRGWASGHFLRSRSVVNLPEGSYATLRFYLGGKNNRFTYSDGVTEAANEFDHLDFTIENGLTVEGNEAAEVKLWFDFAPYKLSKRFKGLTDLFKGTQKPRPRLANSFGN